jgi:hypothetical protein
VVVLIGPLGSSSVICLRELRPFEAAELDETRAHLNRQRGVVDHPAAGRLILRGRRKGGNAADEKGNDCLRPVKRQRAVSCSGQLPPVAAFLELLAQMSDRVVDFFLGVEASHAEPQSARTRGAERLQHV